jgi:ferric-dicitrate binding protein FerR (iron transport regulator)
MHLQEARNFVTYFVRGEYQPKEYAEFLQWLRGATLKELNAIADEYESLEPGWSIPSTVPSPDWVMRLEERLDRLPPSVEESMDDREEAAVWITGVNRFSRQKVWIAAASVAVVLGAGGIWYTQLGSKQELTKTVVPVFAKATANPRGGGQKNFVLDDGTKVWLNDASTLRYPATFDGKERLVELSGEAYFEVRADAMRPFKVKIRDAEVEVLGTDFNVMAYEDEPISRTTLIKGAVRMESGSQHVDLKPGQQAEMPYPAPGVEAQISIVADADANSALGWKDGDFYFENVGVREAMRTLSRSYNVDIYVDPNVPEKPFAATFHRRDGLDHNLINILDLLKLHHHNNNGNTVTVSL